MTQDKTAITPTRDEDFPEWFQQAVKAADLAENSPVRGSMIIKPWGYGIWEKIQSTLDRKIKEIGYQNAYFPLFIPLRFLEKEADHVEGFAKECAVVTHHRLEEKDGKLVPAAELEEPLVVRPTSETIIGDAFSRWVQSYRDLPLLINQWANVVRWEMRPRLFLRTTEFLWQEAHTVLASEKQAREETLKALYLYRDFVEEYLAIPVIIGEKSVGERFPGAVATYTIEMMMQDKKALQGGTSHYFGQNFSKAYNIQFSNQEGVLEHGYTTSWGMTTRTIGGLVMVHGDDDGMRLPPKIAPKQVVIIPVIPKPETAEEVLGECRKIAKTLEGAGISAFVDERDLRGGDKTWEWIKKGVPVRIEIGPRDLESRAVMVARRDKPHKEKLKVGMDILPKTIGSVVHEMQKGYFERAKQFRDSAIKEGFTSFDELLAYFTPKNEEKPEIHGGFARVKWCEDPVTEEQLKEHKLTIRCLPLDQSGKEGRCIMTGRPAKTDIIIAKAY